MSVLEGKRNLVNLNDVDVSTPFADGEAPVWDDATQKFIPGSAGGSGYSDTSIAQIKWFYDLVGGMTVTTDGVAIPWTHALGPATILNITPGADVDGSYVKVQYEGWYEMQYDVTVADAANSEIIVDLMKDSGSGFNVQTSAKGYYFGD